VAAQEEQEGVFFDTVLTATCTGSTQAGMVVGFGARRTGSAGWSASTRRRTPR